MKGIKIVLLSVIPTASIPSANKKLFDDCFPGKSLPKMLTFSKLYTNDIDLVTVIMATVGWLRNSGNQHLCRFRLEDFEVLSNLIIL